MSRQKQALAEELLTARKDLERAQMAHDRILKEKETLNLEKGELVVQVDCQLNHFSGLPPPV